MGPTFHNDTAIPKANESTVWAFSADSAGRHKCGSAVVAHKNFGAPYGLHSGPGARAYAITVMDKAGKSLGEATISENISQFLSFAANHPKLTFHIPRIAAEHKLLTDAQVAPLFKSAPSNCSLPLSWKPLLSA